MSSQTIYLIFLPFASALAMAASISIGMFGVRRKKAEHWSEQARLVYPVRVTAQANLVFIPVIAVLLGLYWFEPEWTESVIIALASFVGSAAGQYPLSRAIYPGLRTRGWLAHVAIGWGMRLISFGPLIAVAAFMPPEWSAKVGLIALLCAAWHLWIVTVGYFQILSALRLIRPVGQEHAALLEDSFRRAQFRPRHIWTLSTPLVLAFAVPTRGALLFTDGLFAQLSAEELRAVCLHELAHLRENRSILRKRIAGSFLWYPFIFLRPAMESAGLKGIAVIEIVFALLLVSNRRLGRSTEVAADAFATQEGAESDPGAYARALETIYRLNLVPAVMPGNSEIHPHLYDRMLAAGVTPEFPRPEAAERYHWTFYAMVIAIFALVILVVA